MAKKEKKPYFGKTCVRCEAPISYLQNQKALIAGHCGKCLDKVRKELVDSVKKELKQNPDMLEFPTSTGRRGGGSGLGRGIAIGAILGVCGIFLLNLVAFGPWSRMITAFRTLVGFE